MARVRSLLRARRLAQEINRLATTDGLTGIYNRRQFFELAEREVNRVRRYGLPLAALMLDLDHYKLVNDRHGHAVGDEVLRQVAARCLKNLRNVDILGRYGGEEFSALLVEADLHTAQQVAARLHRCIGQTPMDTSAGPLAITVSVGIGVLDGDCPHLDALLQRAAGLPHRPFGVGGT